MSEDIFVIAALRDFSLCHWPVQRRPGTKILALTDALGNLVRFVLLPGQCFDTIGVPLLAPST